MAAVAMRAAAGVASGACDVLLRSLSSGLGVRRILLYTYLVNAWSGCYPQCSLAEIQQLMSRGCPSTPCGCVCRTSLHCWNDQLGTARRASAQDSQSFT